MTTKSFAMALAATAATILLARAPALAIAPDDVEKAATAADHQAIAAQYEADAEQLRAKAKMHDEMAARYGKGPSYGKVQGRAVGMSTHCKKLSGAYNSAAEEAEALAKEHREMAAAAEAN